MAFYRLLLRLLPAWLRERAGEEMRALCEERVKEARREGRRGRVGLVWLREVAGIVWVAFQARRRGPWDARPVVAAGGRQRVESFWLDVRYAFRAMARRPVAAALAIVTCGLGIGAASAMFGVVDGVLLKPLSYPDPDRVVSVYPTIEEWRESSMFSSVWDRSTFSYPEFEEWMAEQTSFSSAAAIGSNRATLTGLGPAQVLAGARATPSLFAILGAEPVLGRRFSETDRAADRQVLVSWSFWQTRLGGARDVIGRTLQLNDVAHEIIGVLPERFTLAGFDAEYWLLIGSDYDNNRGNHDLRVVARLADGVTVERAQEEAASILYNLSGLHDASQAITHRARVVPRLEDETRQVRAPLMVLFAGAGLLLLVACVNFATLRLGAGLDRETELNVRVALGAGRSRVARQMVTESVVLALAGALLGLLLAFAITRVLAHIAPAGVPHLDRAAVDARSAAFAIGLATAVGILFGLVPALTLSSGDVAMRIRAGRLHSRGRQRLHGALVIAQTALATILLVGAGVLTRTLLHLDAVDPGFAPDQLLTVRVAPPYERLRREGDDLTATTRAYYDRLVAGVESVPGVQAVAITSTLPFSGDRANNDIEPEGYQPAEGERIVAGRNVVSGNYLEILGVRTREGRLLTPADDRADAEPVAVVSERLAHAIWPDGAIGKRLDFWAGSFTVVGVIEDVHDRTLLDDQEYRFYVTQRQTSSAGGSLVVRTAADPARLIPAIRERLAALDPDLPVTSILPMTRRIADSLAEQRYRARLALAFAAFAAAFTAFGIYGMANRSVARRRPEIGVRLALGARPTAVVAWVLRGGVALTSAGVLLGLAASAFANRAIAAWVYGPSPNDPATLAFVALALTATAAIACLGPSLRAARTDPIAVLRSD